VGRRNKGRAIDGMLMLNKGLNQSSNDALQQVKRLYKAAKAGHTGALDPLATGMLPICLGEATKFSQYLLDAHKTYLVTATLGIRTTTSDADGEVVSEKAVDVSEPQLLASIETFKGEGMQVPSMYSALKHQGKPLYWYARNDMTVDIQARPIQVYEYELLDFDGTNAQMRIRCSKGTYIRTLVDDLGQLLGCGAYVSKLHRESVSHYADQKTYTIEELREIAARNEADEFTTLDALLLPMEAAATDLPELVIDFAQGDRFLHGQSAIADLDCELGVHVRVYRHHENQKQFIGVGEHIDRPRDRSPQLFGKHTFLRPKRLVVFKSNS
jgi:tRNA pseudouridine55 synthase